MKITLSGIVKLVFVVAAVCYFYARCATLEKNLQTEMHDMSAMLTRYEKKAQWMQAMAEKISGDKTVLMRTLDVTYEMCEQYDMPKNVFLGLVYEESRFNPHAKGSDGEVGLCQVLPETGFLVARAYNLKIESVNDLREIENNITVAVLFLNDLVRMYGLRRALAHYNHGRAGMSKRGEKYAAKVLARSKEYADIEVQY